MGNLMLAEGIEPSLYFKNMGLSHARLPVPPYQHIQVDSD